MRLRGEFSILLVDRGLDCFHLTIVTREIADTADAVNTDPPFSLPAPATE